MAVGHGVGAVAVVVGHGEEGALVANLACRGVEVELVNRLLGTISPEHGRIALIPRRAVGDRDVAQRSGQRAVGVEAKEGAVLVPFGHERVEHEARPEAARGVDGAVVAAVFFVLGGADFGGCPDALDPAVGAGLLVGDAEAVFASEGEFGGVAFDVGGAAGDVSESKVRG